MLPARHFRAGDPLAAYEYHLPPERIAQRPARRRTMARLLGLPRVSGPLAHGRVAHLARWLAPGDLLVVNDTRVVPARLRACKPTGGRVEVMLLNPARPVSVQEGREVHQALIKSHRPLAAGTELGLEDGTDQAILVLERWPRGRALVSLPGSGLDLARAWGETPLPPYIRRPQGPDVQDERRYQTVYASREGAVAAPTAGLHLTQGLLDALERRGVGLARVTLHVGYGTFAEPSPEDLAAGRLHAEWVEIGPEAAEAVADCRRRGGRVVAVGTTSLRALEGRAGPGGALRTGAGWCDILIAPGHRFQVVEGLMTNFHLPRTTLLMLVAALAGRERVLAAYAEAIEREYRFYSFGDAMLIL